MPSDKRKAVWSNQFPGFSEFYPNIAARLREQVANGSHPQAQRTDFRVK